MQKLKPLLIFNIRRSVYQHFGLQHFNHLKNHFTLIPIVNNHTASIQQRSAAIINQVKSYLHNNKIDQKIHIVGYSLSGIDTRYAISKLGLSQFCQSFITVASPHRGSKGIFHFDRRHFNEQVFDAIGRIMGVGLKPLTQFVPSNMKSFNEVVQDAQDVKYYSIGGQTLPNSCHKAYRDVCLYLREHTERNYVYENDGVIGFDQCQWGTHLVNFDKDHSQLIGLTGSTDVSDIVKLIKDVQKIKSTNIFQKGKKGSVQI